MHLPFSIAFTSLLPAILTLGGTTLALSHANAAPISHLDVGENPRNVSLTLFMELEELARLVDIAYCVGVTGIRKPFECLSRCSDFPGFELVDTWNTGPLLSDSCGYVALDHTAAPHGRIIVAFRGTYSITNTIVDLTTVPQEYVPYPDDPDGPDDSPDPAKPKRHRGWDWIPHFRWSHTNAHSDETHEYKAESKERENSRWQAYHSQKEPKCLNCTVHSGFLRSWTNTREVVLKHIISSKAQYPSYSIHLVGHSLGGAVAALAGLELSIKGLNPIVTTFGEPRIGNVALRDYLDVAFDLGKRKPDEEQKYRRVTHRDDPVPLLPLTEWGYRMHAGEVFIGKKHIPPEVSDLQLCEGDEDTSCIAGAEPHANSKLEPVQQHEGDPDVLRSILFDYGPDMRSVIAMDEVRVATGELDKESWGISMPARLKMWQLFFAHRDYFWRLGLCVPGGDPRGWLGKMHDPGAASRREVEEL